MSRKDFTAAVSSVSNDDGSYQIFGLKIHSEPGLSLMGCVATGLIPVVGVPVSINSHAGWVLPKL